MEAPLPWALGSVLHDLISRTPSSPSAPLPHQARWLTMPLQALPTYVVTLLFFGGFIIRIEDIPPWWEWVSARGAHSAIAIWTTW